ncbi:hypothetical protein CoNPh20_CDS0032 [Staphylococcus phage S-CoN_Ph20]|nr:hypothetical protein CoNPh18_CDS0040 [Staphylococcus phage S-CoN_Ph18]WNM54658.1 hypothetical protein CoNPh20_CDS0032 [Staphylococcus phage S-CoN_Ph20]
MIQHVKLKVLLALSHCHKVQHYLNISIFHVLIPHM